MGDICDDAARRMEQEEEIRNKAIKHRQRKAKESATEDCVECEAPIPPRRQESTGGTDMCVSCASVSEELNKQWR